jgi:Cu/Ag efflux protein CusF
VSHYNSAHKELKKIDTDVLRITKASPDIEAVEVSVEPMQLERPQSGDDEDEE